MRIQVQMLAVGGLVLLAGCGSAVSMDPVPMVVGADEEFLCSGVPLTGLELMTGVEELAYNFNHAPPRWAIDEDMPFHCSAGEPGSDASLVVVERTDIELVGFGRSADEQIAKIARAWGDDSRIDADAPGAGFVLDDGYHPAARWVCPDGVRMNMTLYVAAEGRDAGEDLERYVRSMLPWMCDADQAPARTVDLPDGLGPIHDR